MCKGSIEKAFNYRDIRNFMKFLLKKLKLPKICFYLLKIEEIGDCGHSLFQKFLNILMMYQEISNEDQDNFFKSKNQIECNGKHPKKENLDEINIMNNFNSENSVEERMMTPSYYSGNILTIEEKKKNITLESYCSFYKDEIYLESSH